MDHSSLSVLEFILPNKSFKDACFFDKFYFMILNLMLSLTATLALAVTTSWIKIFLLINQVVAIVSSKFLISMTRSYLNLDHEHIFADW